MKWFGSAAVSLIDEDRIDTPGNMISLEHELHVGFGSFQLYFEHKGENKYDVQYWDPSWKTAPLMDRRHIELRQHGGSTVELPDPALLDIHKAIGNVLHLSGAAEGIVQLRRDLEVGTVDGNGTTPLGDMVRLHIGAS